MLRPFSVGYVKGWRRCSTMLLAAHALRELQIDLTELPSGFKAHALPRFPSWLGLEHVTVAPISGQHCDCPRDSGALHLDPRTGARLPRLASSRLTVSRKLHFGTEA